MVSLYTDIGKSQEILGNQDSVNLYILSESIKIWNLLYHFFMLRTPCQYTMRIFNEFAHSDQSNEPPADYQSNVHCQCNKPPFHFDDYPNQSDEPIIYSPLISVI